MQRSSSRSSASVAAASGRAASAASCQVASTASSSTEHFSLPAQVSATSKALPALRVDRSAPLQAAALCLQAWVLHAAAWLLATETRRSAARSQPPVVLLRLLPVSLTRLRRCEQHDPSQPRPTVTPRRVASSSHCGAWQVQPLVKPRSPSSVAQVSATSSGRCSVTRSSSTSRPSQYRCCAGRLRPAPVKLTPRRVSASPVGWSASSSRARRPLLAPVSIDGCSTLTPTASRLRPGSQPRLGLLPVRATEPQGGLQQVALLEHRLPTLTVPRLHQVLRSGPSRRRHQPPLPRLLLRRLLCSARCRRRLTVTPPAPRRSAAHVRSQLLPTAHPRRALLRRSCARCAQMATGRPVSPLF